MAKKNSKKGSKVQNTTSTVTTGPVGVPAPVEPKQNVPSKATPGQTTGHTLAALTDQAEPKLWLWFLLMAGFFLLSVFTSISVIKPVLVGLIIVTVVLCLIRLSVLQSRVTVPVLAVVLWIIVSGISTLYAITGKFALREFTKLMAGFCVFLLVLAWSKKDGDRGRTVAAMIEGNTALAALFSIDMLSTHWLSGPLFRFLGVFSEDYTAISMQSAETGARMLSMYTNPNVFAGMVGIGVLLSLELAVTSNRNGKRIFHLVCLFLNALAFLLVFSMGATATIAVAFLVFLFLERKERKGTLLVLMIETFALALLAAFPIFLTSFKTWNGFQPIPFLCAIAGSALLCVADRYVGQRLSQHLESRGKMLPAIIVAILAAVVAFGALAVTVTGPISLSAGSTLRRGAYPDPGTYTLDVEATGALTVTIESQNQVETMMHTETVLYSGDVAGAVFTVPEDSKVVYFNFFAQQDLVLNSVTYQGNSGNGHLKLNYKFLPGFVANRLQGLFANENAIQRTVFFDDGIKIFLESPIFGQGLGAFESAVRHVQSFDYETKYTHNHYIETLINTGVIGFVIFAGMLLLMAAAIWKHLRKEDTNPLAPGLGAALVFMSAHGVVEFTFSVYYYLLVAFGVFGLICLCCGDEFPFLAEKSELKSWGVVAVLALALLFDFSLYMNIIALRRVQNTPESKRFVMLEWGDKVDLYDWTDYELTYIYLARGIDQIVQAQEYDKANEYAANLLKGKSNTFLQYVAEYYFSTGQRELAYRALEKHVTCVAASSEAWQRAFDLMMEYTEETPEHHAEVAKLYQMFQNWNEEHIGTVTLTDMNNFYISAMLYAG